MRAAFEYMTAMTHEANRPATATFLISFLFSCKCVITFRLTLPNALTVVYKHQINQRKPMKECQYIHNQSVRKPP